MEEIFEFENKSYLVSLLIMTRKNPKNLKKLIDNFTNLADKDLDNYEFIVSVDFDDSETIDLIKEISNEFTNLKFIVSSRLRGYSSMNEFQRDSAYMARGKYLMVMGDDAEMVTPNWNKILQDKLTEFKFYFCNFDWIELDGTVNNIKDLPEPEWAEDRTFLSSVGVNFHDFIYICFPRKIVELWGFISPHALTDNFIGDVAKRVTYFPWETSVYEFIDEVKLNHFDNLPSRPANNSSFNSEKVYLTYQHFINDALFFDCANKVKEYVEWEKWHKQHKLNIINDFRNSGLNMKEYFNMK